MAETKSSLVLVADDDEQLRGLYVLKLENSGFRVATAGNGVEACQLAKNLQPDLILMDYEMPVMNGVEALTKLKADPATANLKVAFLTAFGDPSAEHRAVTDTKFAQDAGALDYIRKGIDLDELITKVRGYIGNQ